MNQEMRRVDSSSPAGALMKYTSYMECQKNHAAAIGRTEHDGCQEFLAAGPEGTPEAFKCAACHCHRNFHRKQVNAFPAAHHRLRHLPTHLQFVAVYGPPPGFQFPLGLPEPPKGKEGGGGGRGSRDFEEQEEMANSTTDTDSNNAVNKAPKKRFRTRFSKEQREKMLGLAEEIGWRTRKEHKEAMRQLCEEIGVPPHVFKVWVKNNKATLRKKP